MTSERKPRKSVAFSEGTTIVDSHGEVTESNGTSDKTSAEHHSASMSTELVRASDRDALLLNIFPTSESPRRLLTTSSLNLRGAYRRRR